MSLRITNSSQTDADLTTNLTSAARSESTAETVETDAEALDQTQDTATISSSSSQLASELPVRQDKVDALRAQVKAGTYSVDSRAVATAMFQNLFGS